ncbi:hypothetical protein TCDM_03720 [Trypanosoma cruzi Dm28c]|uniref:Uncharacterized protein n=1 Tax=Trypanosoma cruzi Dm28c TaxID=1416333 RepID=V5BSW9_TRYCR|nr:hypothetical protein TCDM_03720 [Trypanosoma cruzi Dm28c]
MGNITGSIWVLFFPAGCIEEVRTVLSLCFFLCVFLWLQCGGWDYSFKEDRRSQIYYMRAGNHPRENTRIKRVPHTTRRLSVYPYKDQHFITAGSSVRRSPRKNREVYDASRRTLPRASIPISNGATEADFPRKELEEIAAWLASDAIFLEIESLAARAHVMCRQEETLRNDTNTAATAYSGNGSATRKRGLRLETNSSMPSLPLDEEAYARQIFDREAPKQQEGNFSRELSTPPEPYVGDTVAQPAGGQGSDVGAKIEQMISLQQPAYGRSALLQKAEDGEKEGSKSPTVVELKEEILQGDFNARSSSHSSPSMVQVGISVSVATGAESSLGDGAVSLRDASPPRSGACFVHSSCKTDLYNVVQIPRAHYILSEVNFSHW